MTPTAKGQAGMKTVLIVDPDLGFVFWLGQVLGNTRWQAVPAKDFQTAMALLRELHLEKIDLLILNPSVQGAADFVQALRISQPNLKVAVALSENEQNPARIENADSVIRKPRLADRAAGALWLRIIESLLIGYFVA